MAHCIYKRTIFSRFCKLSFNDKATLYIDFPLDSISQLLAYLCDYFYTCATRMQSQQLTTAHQTIDADKSISSAHLKRWMTFSQRENQTFYFCIQKSTDVRKLITESLNTSASNTTHNFLTRKGRKITNDGERRKWNILEKTQTPT